MGYSVCDCFVRIDMMDGGRGVLSATATVRFARSHPSRHDRGI